MLRKSPYLDENYGYITTMMDNINIQEDFINKPCDQLINENSNSNLLFLSPDRNRQSFSIKNINSKKQVEIEHSIFGKILILV
jgi:hypothetical protein